jgi:voltage-gated potassium channel
MGRESRSKPYQVFMLGLCIYVLLALAGDTFFKLAPETSQLLGYVDTAVCVIFLADFLYNLATARSKLGYLKWGWIDLISSIPMVDFLRIGRIARVIRILRILRGVRSTKMLVAYILERRAEGTFAVVGLVSLIVVVFSSIAILHCEVDAGSNIKTPSDALWWSFVTITTVGYGDRFPVTPEGRVVAAVLMLAGVGLFGTFTGFVASWFLSPGEREQDNDLDSIRRELAEIKALLAAQAQAAA